jgi:hypothetical protein
MIRPDETLTLLNDLNLRLKGNAGYVLTNVLSVKCRDEQDEIVRDIFAKYKTELAGKKGALFFYGQKLFCLNNVAQYGSAVTFDTEKKALSLTGTMRTGKTKIDLAETMVKEMVTITEEADVYLVKGEMTDVIAFASNQLDETDTFDLELVPSLRGFAYFEKGVETNDIEGNKYIIHAVLWEMQDGQIVYYLFNNFDVMADDSMPMLERTAEATGKSVAEFRRNVGKWLLSSVESAGHGEKVGGKKRQEQFELDADYWKENYQNDFVGMDNFPRFMHAYFLMMSQTIVSTEKKIPQRGIRKSMEKAKLPSEYVVVQLRKTEYKSGEKSDDGRFIDWSHRWVVGGHWRWQPYKETGKKRIWIAPYVKGPDDKPLVMKDKVYVLAK